MSNRYAHTYSRVMHDVQTMSATELGQEYGLEILEDDSVWDACEMKTYASLNEWATFMRDQEKEDAAYTPSSSRKTRYEDD